MLHLPPDGAVRQGLDRKENFPDRSTTVEDVERDQRGAQDQQPDPGELVPCTAGTEKEDHTVAGTDRRGSGHDEEQPVRPQGEGASGQTGPRLPSRKEPGRKGWRSTVMSGCAPVLPVRELGAAVVRR